MNSDATAVPRGRSVVLRTRLVLPVVAVLAASATPGRMIAQGPYVTPDDDSFGRAGRIAGPPTGSARPLPSDCQVGTYTEIQPCVRTVTAPPNASNQTVTFTIYNYDQWEEGYALQCFVTAPVTSCNVYSDPFAVGAGASREVDVTFSTSGSLGTGSVKLQADGLFGGDQAWAQTSVSVASYGVAVTPDGGSQSAYTGSTGNVARFTVHNHGNQGSLTYALSIVGCSAPLVNCTADAPSVTVGQGLSQDVTVDFDAQSTTGTGTVTLRATHTASGTNDNGSINVTVTVAPSYAVQVTPDGGSQSVSAGSAGTVATFSVKNEGNQGSLTYALSIVGCTAPVINCAVGEDPPTVTVTQGLSQDVTVYFSAQSTPGVGTVTLRATHSASGTFNDGSINVTVVSYGVSVTPDGGTSPTRAANTGGHSEPFTVINTGSASNTFSFTCSGSGGVTCGAPPPSAPLARNGGPGDRITVSMPYSVGAPGTGTLTLTATGTNASNPGSYSVPIVSYGVSVTPDGEAAATRAANTGGHSESFTVVNTGSASNTFSFTCSGAGGVTCGTVPAPVPLARNGDPGDRATLSMSFSVGGPGIGTLTFTATGTNASDPGSYSVPIVSYGVSVTPDGGSAPTRTANTGGHSETFTVVNTGSASNTFSFTCSGAGGVTCGTVPNSVPLARSGDPGDQATVSMPYSVGAAGTGTLTLTANGTNASDPGSYSVPIVSYGVSVTPDGGSAPTRTANTGGHSETFTVVNTGSQSNTFSFTCSGAGGVTCGTVPNSVPLARSGDPGDQATVSMPYSVGAPGTGTLTLTATGTNASNPGSYSVPIVSYGVSVTPDGGTAPTRGLNTGGHSETFTVTNTGSAENTFSFTCSGTGGVTCGTVPAPVPVAGNNGQVSVSMPYNVGDAGTGTLTLTATGTNATNQGWYRVPISLSGVSAAGAFTMDSRYLLVETAEAYDAWGRIDSLTDARGKATSFDYGGNANDAFLTKVTRWKDATGSADLVTDIAYDPDGYVASIKDEGGTFRYFGYDLYGRLTQLKNHEGTVVAEYGYTYSRTSANGWLFDASSPNAVTTTTFLQQSPTPTSVVSTEYLDGLGRPIQSVVENGTADVVTATEYDAMGRLWRTWAPYAAATASYVPTFSADAEAFYNTYYGTSPSKPYVETAYRPDALDRVRRVAREYIGTTPPDSVATAYGIEVTPKHTITEVTDEAGKKRRDYADVFGNTVKTVLGYGTADETITTFGYNVLGHRTRATDPRGLVTTYTFDTRGLLTAKTSPDAGTVQHQYDQAGNLRYTQDANQDAAGQVYFTTYDFANRPLVSGLGAADFGSLNAFTSTAFEGTEANWLVVRQYDGMPPASFPWTLFPTPPPLTNVGGRLAAVASKSNGAWQATFFSYDADGQVAKRHTYTQANGGGSVLTALNTTSTYVRDLRGALTARADTVGSATFHHWYEYDPRGLLWKVFAATTDAKPAAPDVTYTYRPSGQVESRQFLGEPQPVPLRYTIREQLQQIGDPAGTVYPFSAFYAYHPNGTVKEAEFYNAGSPATEKRYRYVFGTASYDALNRLKSADYQGWNGGWTLTAAHDLANIDYDAAGNLTRLQRYRQDGSLVDDLTYGYPTTSNRLSSITDAVTGNAETWDARSGSFTYDANGNLKTAPAPYGITAVTYDHQNLALSLTSNGAITAYRYNEAGQRITNQVGTGNTEVYLLDGATSLGVFTVNSAGSPTTWFFNVLAADKVVGRQPDVGNRRYYHTDLLGSTRAVVEGTTVVESYDFEPWGLLMPGRTLAGATKEGFTSKERDGETGLDYFGARYYMPALARWTAVDPLAEKHPEWSPFNYVLNNPLALLDPDGRQVSGNWTTFMNVSHSDLQYLQTYAPLLASGQMQPTSRADVHVQLVYEKIEQDAGRVVIGGEGTVPIPWRPGMNAGLSVDLSLRGIDVDPIVTIGTPGLSANIGLVTSLPREGDISASGQVVTPAGIGVSQGVAWNNGEVRPTDTRFVIGTPQARHSLEVAFAIPIPNTPAAVRPGPIEAPRDATAVRVKPPEPPKRPSCAEGRQDSCP